MPKANPAAPAAASTDERARPTIGNRTMTVEQALEVKKGLEALDALEHIGYATFVIAQNMNRLEMALKPYNDARSKLIKRLSEGTMTILPTIEKNGRPEPNPKHKEFLAEHGRMTDQEITVKIFPIKLSDLKMDRNVVKPSALSALMQADAVIDDSDDEAPQSN